MIVIHISNNYYFFLWEIVKKKDHEGNYNLCSGSETVFWINNILSRNKQNDVETINLRELYAEFNQMCNDLYEFESKKI